MFTNKLGLCGKIHILSLLFVSLNGLLTWSEIQKDKVHLDGLLLSFLKNRLISNFPSFFPPFLLPSLPSVLFFFPHSFHFMYVAELWVACSIILVSSLQHKDLIFFIYYEMITFIGPVLNPLSL